MKSIVITGATSFIGVHLLQQLYTGGHEIYAVVREGSKNIVRLKDFPEVKIVFCNIVDMDNLRELLPKKINLFYHLAWEGARRPYRDDEAMQLNNYNAALKAYNVARDKGCRKFIGVGSQAEYGKTIGLISENYPTQPGTMYGKYKLRASQELLQNGKQDDVSVIWPRIFSVYGHFDNPETLIMTALQKFRKNERLPMTEGVQNWNYLYVKDIARMLSLLGLSDCETGIYNFASRDNRSLREYILELKELTRSDSVLDFGAVPYGSEGVVSFEPDISKFIKNFPSFSFSTFQDGVKELLKYSSI